MIFLFVCFRDCPIPEPEANSAVDLSDILADAELDSLSGPHLDAGRECVPGDTLPPNQADDMVPPCQADKTLPPRQANNTLPPSQSSRSQTGAPPQVTEEQLSQMIDTVTQLLEDQQAKDRRSTQGKTKEDQIQIDLTTDLLKYLGTSGDTALSRTPVGKKILLAAPTGKAAKLLGHKAKMESCTLHRVIFSYRAFVKAQQQKKRKEEAERRRGEEERGPKEREVQKNDLLGDWRKDEKGNPVKTEAGHSESEDDKRSNTGDSTPEEVWKYACTQVLVVDECSLVSLRLFATLLKILLENTPLEKIVLLGDIRQLPSIEPGNFLSDVFTTFRERGFSVELRTNHRSESELIVSNATRISQRQLPVIDPARHFHFCTLEDTQDSADPGR